VCGRRYVTINPWVANHSSVQERSPFRKWPFPPAATKSTCRDGLRWSKRISNPWSPVRRLTGGFYARGTKGSNPFPSTAESVSPVPSMAAVAKTLLSCTVRAAGLIFKLTSEMFESALPGRYVTEPISVTSAWPRRSCGNWTSRRGCATRPRAPLPIHFAMARDRYNNASRPNDGLHPRDVGLDGGGTGWSASSLAIEKAFREA